MPGPSELMRKVSEQHQVQPTAPFSGYVSPLSTAVSLLRQGRSLPNGLIEALIDEDHDITGLVRSIRPASP